MAQTKPRPKNEPLIRCADFALGGIERNGEHVTISYENGVYVIRRSPHHPAGHGKRLTFYLRTARIISSTLRKEKPQP